MEYFIDNYINIKIDEKFAGKKLNEFLDYFKQSRKNKYLLIKENKIMLNNQTVNLECFLKVNDWIKISINKSVPDYKSDSEAAEVVYEDEIVLIVNKPSRIIVHDKENSLANKVARYYELNNYHYPIRYIHRLDEDTRGLLMFCKLSFFQPYFDDALYRREIKRHYYAIVFNKLDKEILIDKPLGRNRHDSKKQIVSASGKKALTKVKPLSYKNGFSLVECELFTGRTHQIRVHLNSEKLYIVNDILYGKKTKVFKEMGLIAHSLSWTNPLNNKKMVVKLPPDKALDYFKMS